MVVCSEWILFILPRVLVLLHLGDRLIYRSIKEVNGVRAEEFGFTRGFGSGFALFCFDK